MSDKLWLIIEIIVNIYQGFICSYFVISFLKPKEHTNIKLYYLLSGGLHALLITVLNHTMVFESFASILYFLELFIFALIMLKGNIIKKVFASAMPLLTGFVISMFTLNFLSSINKMTIEELITAQGITRLVLLLATQLLYYISFKILLILFRTEAEKFSLYDWSSVIAVMSATVVLAVFLHKIAIKSTNQQQRIYINYAIIILLVLNILTYYLIKTLVKKNNHLKELEMLQIKEKYQQQYIDNANIQYDAIKKVRHDLRNKFLIIQQMIKDNNIDDALSFLSKSQKLTELSEPYINTNNSIVNVVVNSKLSSASAMGIRVACMSTNDFGGIDDIDLCDLLSNVLDNAISACLNNKDTDNEISLSILYENGGYTFLVKNTISESVLDKNPNLKTTKKQKSEHGYGTQIIKDIAKKYDGRYDFYEKNNMFNCQILLKETTLNPS